MKYVFCAYKLVHTVGTVDLLPNILNTFDPQRSVRCHSKNRIFKIQRW